MSFDWTGYLDLARELASATGQEARLRTAISRAYYAAFHQARIHLEREGVAMHHNGSDHGRVKRAFRDNPDPTRGWIGATLERLLEDRNQSDYDDWVADGWLAKAAEAAVEDAAEVILALAALAGTPEPR